MSACIFNTIGCAFYGTDNDQERHLRDHAKEHVMLLSRHSNAQTQSLFSYRHILEQQNIEIKALYHCVAEQKRKVKKHKTEIEFRIKSMEILANHCVCDQENKVKETSEGFEWTITDFTEKIKTAQYFYVDLYVKSRGAKMRVAFNPPNVGIVNTPHVSMLCGNFDLTLTWPFIGSITFRVFKVEESDGSTDKTEHTRPFNIAIIGKKPVCNNEIYIPICTFKTDEVLKFIQSKTVVFLIKILE